MNKKAIDELRNKIYAQAHLFSFCTITEHEMKQAIDTLITEYDKALRDAIKKKVDGFAFTPADRRTIKYIIRNTEVKP